MTLVFIKRGIRGGRSAGETQWHLKFSNTYAIFPLPAFGFRQ